MPTIVRHLEAITLQVHGTCINHRWIFKPLLCRGCRSLVGLALATVFLLAGCGPSQSESPSAEVLTAAAPVTADVVPVTSETVEGQGSSTQDGRPLAARVNDYPILLDDYAKQVAQTEKALKAQGLILEGDQGQAQLNQARKIVLNGLIEQAIIEQSAAEVGIAVSEEELEATIQQSISLGQGQESFEKWLAENNLTAEDFRETQRSQLLANKMIEYVTARVPTTAEQVHARHIRVQDTTRAQELLDELRAGANFAALAQQASEDFSTSANGGDLGWFPHDVPLMPPVVVDAAFALQPGEISGVIQSEQGYHIVKVEARDVNRPLTPEMLLYVRQNAFKGWLAEQQRTAVIERYVDD